MRVFFIAIALALASCGVALADATDCGRIDDQDLAVRSCTILIEGQASGNVAVAYINCAHAFDSKGDYDRAIADYDQAIQLNLQHARAYYGRGAVYDTKGDYDRATLRLVTIFPGDAPQRRPFDATH